MALAKGRSVIRTGPLTLHTTTAIHIAELITKVAKRLLCYCYNSLLTHTHTHTIIIIVQTKFTVRNVEGEKDVYLMECEGIGHENASLG